MYKKIILCLTLAIMATSGVHSAKKVNKKQSIKIQLDLFLELQNQIKLQVKQIELLQQVIDEENQSKTQKLIERIEILEIYIQNKETGFLQKIEKLQSKIELYQIIEEKNKQTKEQLLQEMQELNEEKMLLNLAHQELQAQIDLEEKDFLSQVELLQKAVKKYLATEASLLLKIKILEKENKIAEEKIMTMEGTSTERQALIKEVAKLKKELKKVKHSHKKELIQQHSNHVRDISQTEEANN